MIVLDAGVLIAHLRSGDPFHLRATALLDEHAADGFAMSGLTRAAVLVHPARMGRHAETERVLDDLEIGVVPLDVAAAPALAVLRAETSLRMPDCCVLHAADRLGAPLATFDDRLAAAATARGLRAIR